MMICALLFIDLFIYSFDFDYFDFFFFLGKYYWTFDSVWLPLLHKADTAVISLLIYLSIFFFCVLGIDTIRIIQIGADWIITSRSRGYSEDRRISLPVCNDWLWMNARMS